MSVMVSTSLGDLVIDLFTDRCPLTCKNFLKLCKIKYYNGCLFHTVQKDFTAQTGDPTGTGSGGDSFYKFMYGDQARFFNDEIHPDLKHSKMGTVAMASGGENLNASQFYITLWDDLDYLDEKHTVFGVVAEFHDTLTRINEAYVDDKGRPFKNIRIKHTYVLDDPFEDPSQLAELMPDASPQGKPVEEVIDEVRLEDDWVPMDAQLNPEELEETIRSKEAHSRAIVLETIGDLPIADVKPPENVLFVCKLNPVTEDEDLHTIFSRFGIVSAADIIRDYKTGDSLCYAFIEFEDKDACERAYFKMDNALIDDRRIHVDFSQSVSKLWNQFRQKNVKGNSCYKCGSLDHIAKDCGNDGTTNGHQKNILKDDNKQHGGNKNAGYEMVFDEGQSPLEEERRQKRRDYGSRYSGHRVKNENSRYSREGGRDDEDYRDSRRGYNRDDKDHREMKRNKNVGYEMVFDEGRSPREEKRRQKPIDSGHWVKNDKYSREGGRDDEDYRDGRRGYNRDDKDHREIKRSHSRDNDRDRRDDRKHKNRKIY